MKSIVTFSISKEVLETIDKKRGLATRSAYVENALAEHLKEGTKRK